MEEGRKTQITEKEASSDSIHVSSHQKTEHKMTKRSHRDERETL